MPTCCDCKQDLPKSSFAKSQFKKAASNRRCLDCGKLTASITASSSTAAAAAAAAAEPSVPKNAGRSTRDVTEAGLEVTQSIGGTETAAMVERFVSGSGSGGNREAVEIAKDAAATAPVPARAPVASKKAKKKDEGPPQPEKTATAAPTASLSSTSSAIPPGLADIMPRLTPSQQTLVTTLCSPPLNQSHLFASWPPSSGKKTNGNSKAAFSSKLALIEQLERMDQSYPSGGLPGYITNARSLLAKSRRGTNPLEGWEPRVPRGEAFDVGTDRWQAVEERGTKFLGKCGFVLVAGGLGERLGYGDIKIGLPTELATGTRYIQYYIETILAYQSRYAKPGTKLPLCIMTSGDTNAKTVALLKANDNFGMDDDQVTIVQQGDGVPALSDNDATMALDPADPYRILAKPHGHGDVHALLHSHGVAKRWLTKLKMDYAVFFQDTNGLAFHCLALALGVSDELDLAMNSIACPRKAKQAIGGIAKLVKTSNGEERTLNVEYNQLDPLLRATGHPDGDVNDPATGYSPFPGNINQLVFQLKPYTAALDRTKGAMPEFVNPKYADAAKTVFKKPTRLECMMQDFPTVLAGTPDASRVGFTSVAPEICFSPVKNATSDGVALQAKGTAPGVAASGEADQYNAVCAILRSMGCAVEQADPAVFGGIRVVPGPQIVLKPSFVCCPGEYSTKFPDPTKVKISAKSSLVVEGSGVTIESLDLDGALVVACEEGATGVIRNLVVKNGGWVKVADDSSTDEIIKMRAYHLNKVATKRIVFKNDGTIEGGYDPSTGIQKKRAEPSEGKCATVNSRDVPSLAEPTEDEAKEKTNDCGCTIL